MDDQPGGPGPGARRIGKAVRKRLLGTPRIPPRRPRMCYCCISPRLDASPEPDAAVFGLQSLHVDADATGIDLASYLGHPQFVTITRRIVGQHGRDLSIDIV